MEVKTKRMTEHIDEKELNTSAFVFMQVLQKGPDDLIEVIIEMVNNLSKDQREIWLRTVGGLMRSVIWKSIDKNHEMLDFPLFTENPVSMAEGLMKSEEIAFQEKMR